MNLYDVNKKSSVGCILFKYLFIVRKTEPVSPEVVYKKHKVHHESHIKIRNNYISKGN